MQPFSAEQRAQLTGHTALCLTSLSGFFLYTASYSLVYQMKGGKPVAIVEMWMVLTHLLSALITCAVQAAIPSSVVSRAQTSLFLAIALVVSITSTACLQDAAQCALYYPAAAWPNVAAIGAISWSWVMYVASLGCQSSYLTLGLSEGIVLPVALALYSPHVLFTLQNTCGVACTKSPVLACNIPVHLVLLVLALLVWYAAAFTALTAPLRLVATLLIILDAALVLTPAPTPWIVSIATLYSFVSQNVNLNDLFSSLAHNNNNNNLNSQSQPQQPMMKRRHQV